MFPDSQTPGVEKIIIRESVDSELIRNSLLADLALFNQSIRKEVNDSLASLRSSLSSISSKTDSNVRMITLSQKIDSLDGTTLKNITISKVSGLTDADIPNDITVTGSQSLTSVSLSSTLSATGLATLSGGILVNNATSTITNLSILNSTSTNATSTFLSVSSLASTSALTVSNDSTLRTLTGTGLFTLTGGLISNFASSTITNLSISFSTSTQATSTYLAVSTLASTSQLIVSTSLNLGTSTATTTSGTLVAQGLLNILGTGTSTFANGLNITTGCYSVGGSCLSTVAGTDSQIQYNNNGAMGGAGNFVFDDTNTRVGIGTSTPGSLFSLASLTTNTNADFLLSGINMIYASSSTTTIPTTGINAFSIATSTSAIPMLTFDSTNSRVGFGTTSPEEAFSVAGTGYFAGNVGVGTTLTGRPLAKLVSASGVNAFPATSGSSESGVALRILGADNAGIDFGANGTSGTWIQSRNQGNFAQNFDLLLNPNGGNVGIGTTSPNSLLSVEGSEPLIAFSDTRGGKVFYWRNNFDSASKNTLMLMTSQSTSDAKFVVDTDGKVGIGDATPDGILDIEGNFADAALRVFNDGNATTRSGIDIQSGTDDASGTNTSISFNDGDGTNQGSITFSGGTVTYGAFTANHDVQVPDEYNKAGYPYGTLLCITSVFYGEGQRAINYNTEACHDGPYSKRVLGAYAGKYEQEENKHQVYILGDGHIRVNNEGGNIRIGDPITTSSQEGIGMKATKSGLVIGIAQEDYEFKDSNDIKLVPVQYHLGYPALDGNISTILSDPTNAWSVDQQSGKVNVTFFGTLNLNGNDIINVSKILGMDGKWKIDSDGTLTAVRVITDELIAKSVKTETLCIGATCITEAELLKLLGKTPAAVPDNQPLIVDTPTEPATTTETQPNFSDENLGGQAATTTEVAITETASSTTATTTEP